jgi:hypothetical protein
MQRVADIARFHPHISPAHAAAITAELPVLQAHLKRVFAAALPDINLLADKRRRNPLAGLGGAFPSMTTYNANAFAGRLVQIFNVLAGEPLPGPAGASALMPCAAHVECCGRDAAGVQVSPLAFVENIRLHLHRVNQGRIAQRFQLAARASEERAAAATWGEHADAYAAALDRVNNALRESNDAMAVPEAAHLAKGPRPAKRARLNLDAAASQPLFTCPVCLDDPPGMPIRTLGCSHNCCKTCVLKIIDYNENPLCPICKEPITKYSDATDLMNALARVAELRA